MRTSATAAARACDLCGGTSAELLFEAQGYPILRCRACELVYTGAAVKQEAAEDYYRDQYFTVASDYADSLKHSATAGSEDHDERVRVISGLARREGRKVLDIGCASGALLAAFQRAGWECCGIEPSAELAAYARQALGCEIHQSLLETAPLAPEAFDVITASHVLEHSPSPRRFLARCHELLKPHGVLLVEVPDFGSRSAQKQRESWLPLYPDTHLYHFTIATLSRLLGETGFRVARFRRYGGLGALAASPPQGDADGGTNGGAGHAEEPSATDRLKRRIFEARRVLYRLPVLKAAARHAYWHVLRMNEYLSVYAVKEDGGKR